MPQEDTLTSRKRWKEGKIQVLEPVFLQPGTSGGKRVGKGGGGGLVVCLHTLCFKYSVFAAKAAA